MATGPDNTQDNPGIMVLTFTLCGCPDTENTVEIEKNTTTTGDCERALLQEFGAEDDNSVIRLHFGTEPCSVQRSVQDLFNIIASRGMTVPDEVFCLHFLGSTTSERSSATDEEMTEPLNQVEDSTLHADETSNDDSASASDANNVMMEDDNGQGPEEDEVEHFEIQANNDPLISVKLNFVSDPSRLPLDPMIWSERTLSFPSKTSFKDVFVDMLEHSRLVLGGDPALCRKGQQCIRFRPCVTHRNERARYANHDQFGKSHIEHLEDFFEDPSADDLSISVTAHLTLDGTWSTSDAPFKILFQAWCRDYEIYRIGDDAEGGMPYHCDTKDTLVGWLDKKNKKAKLGVHAVRTCLVNGRRLGDCDTGRLIGGIIPASLALDERYGGISASESMISEFLKADENAAITEALARDSPVAPVYSFNHSGPEMRGVGYHKWPDGKNIIVNVRFVDLWTKTATDGTAEWLPFYDHGSVLYQGGNTFPDVMRSVNHQLEDVVGKKEQSRIDALFNDHNVGKWKYLLWVLPQKRNVTKMFRFQGGSLARFMSADGKSRQLYMEAHIVAA